LNVLGGAGAEALILVMLVAGVAGFVTGLTGFGTALVAVGLWLHLLPPAFVPPLAVISSVVAQLASVPVVRGAIRWRDLAPYLVGGAVGVPLGVALLHSASPSFLRLTVGGFLVGFAVWELTGRGRGSLEALDSRVADLCVGAGGGLLGGFAGLSAPVPVVWLRLRGGTPDAQRAIYQPFNLLVLTWAGLTMASAGLVTSGVIVIAAFCIPVILLGASLGARLYSRLEHTHFRRIVLALLVASGLSLLFTGQ